MSTFPLRLESHRPPCDRAARLLMWLRCTLYRLHIRRDRRRRSRHLNDLDHRMLRDIGITRADALKASTRPFEQPD
ncbi:MAG: DUF1127 domain-containing protein [Pseudomonadota bacterium]